MNESRDDQYDEAFRRGYEQARRAFEPTLRLDRPVEAEMPRQREAETYEWLFGFSGVDEEQADDDTSDGAADRSPSPFAEDADRGTGPTPGAGAAAHAGSAAGANAGPTDARTDATADHAHDPAAERRRRTVLAAAGLGLGALVLVGAAFGIGRMVAGDGEAGDQAAEEAASQNGTDSGTAPFDGPVRAVQVEGSSASCQAPGSTDAAGNGVSYEPVKAHDDDLSTAWRCAGRGAGERLTLDLPDGTRVAEVGLVPGYAKTDPVDGTDRYAQNNRITQVRWTFDDGTRVVQRMAGAPGDRSMRTIRVPVTQTGTVVLEILRSVPGPRNTIAVSEVRVAGPAD